MSTKKNVGTKAWAAGTAAFMLLSSTLILAHAENDVFIAIGLGMGAAPVAHIVAAGIAKVHDKQYGVVANFANAILLVIAAGLVSLLSSHLAAEILAVILISVAVGLAVMGILLWRD